VHRRVAVGELVLDFATDDPSASAALQALYHAAPPAPPGGGTDRPADLHYRLNRRPEGWLAHSPARPPFGPTSLSDAWAFLEWRATEDLLAAPRGAIYLHGAGICMGGRGVLLIGPSGAGKSTLAAHLAARGYRVWGDDLVRFAPVPRHFSASERSWKLDDKSLSDIELLSEVCAGGAPGTFFAPPCWYVSPAAIRVDWRAEPGSAGVVVLLEASRHAGPARVERTSEGAAALEVAQALIGADRVTTPGERANLMTSVLEALEDAVAFEARGNSPRALAVALEEALA